MRSSKLSAAKQHNMELEADDQRRTRATGFAKMHERDRSWATLDNGVTILWSVTRELESGETRDNIPEGKFALVINGKKHLFDTDEFRQALRWA